MSKNIQRERTIKVPTRHLHAFTTKLVTQFNGRHTILEWSYSPAHTFKYMTILFWSKPKQ